MHLPYYRFKNKSNTLFSFKQEFPSEMAAKQPVWTTITSLLNILTVCTKAFKRKQVETEEHTEND